MRWLEAILKYLVEPFLRSLRSNDFDLILFRHKKTALNLKIVTQSNRTDYKIQTPQQCYFQIFAWGYASANA